MKRLVIAIVALLLIIVFIITIPISFEYSLGDQTLPDSAIYKVELIGESIKCTLTLDRKECLLDLADERDQEAVQLQKKRNKTFDGDLKERYDFMIVTAENAASRLRIEALGE